jgi:membrane-bound serine protease (ClpP class)
MDIELIILLYAVGIGLLFAELFLPGIVIGLVGVGCVGTSIWFMYASHGAIAGTAQLVASVGIVAGIAVFWARRLTQSGTQTDPRYTSADESLPDLVGREGEAVSPLRPAGVVRIEGRRVDVVTRGEMIDAGAAVKVVEVEGNRVVVREMKKA